MSKLMYRKDLDRVLTADEVDGNFLILDKKQTIKLAPPTVTDDVTKGQSLGDIWIDTFNKFIYVCVLIDEGSAEWKLLDLKITNLDFGEDNKFSNSEDSVIVVGHGHDIDYGKDSLIMGNNNYCYADRSIVIGSVNVTPHNEDRQKVDASIIIGEFNIGGIGNSLILGNENKSSISYSNMLGISNEIYGQFHSIIGYENLVGSADDFNYFNAISGRNNIINGAFNYNFIKGENNKVSNHHSFLVGNNLHTNTDGQVLFGQFNRDDSSIVLAYGNGVDTDNRSNLIEVYKDGSVIAPSLEILNDANPKILVNKEFVNKSISETPLGTKDTTANRPANPRIGLYHFDTDLSSPIWYNGSDWTDASGTVV